MTHFKILVGWQDELFIIFVIISQVQHDWLDILLFIKIHKLIMTQWWWIGHILSNNFKCQFDYDITLHFKTFKIKIKRINSGAQTGWFDSILEERWSNVLKRFQNGGFALHSWMSCHPCQKCMTAISQRECLYDLFNNKSTDIQLALTH